MNSFFFNKHNKSIRLIPNGFSLYKKNDSGEVSALDNPNTSATILTTAVPTFFATTDKEPVDIIVNSTPVMLIPLPLFNVEKSKEYLKLQFNVTDVDNFLFDEIDDYVALYFINHNEEIAINNIPVIPTFIHETTLFYHFLSTRYNNYIAFSFNNGFTDVIVKKEGTLLLINRLSFEHATDLLYTTLNYVQQYRLSLDTLSVILFNCNTLAHQFYDIACNYIPTIIEINKL